MKIIEPSFEILNPATKEEGIQLLQRIEKLARISHKSEEKQTEDSWKRFIQAVVIEHGDFSVIEHCNASVIFRMDRAVCMEFVRHRLFSYTMESTRFVNYEKKGELEFVKPSFQGDDPVSAAAGWNADIYQAEQAYLDQLKMGQSPQIARSLLPNALAASIAVSGNLRVWRHLFLMRASRETHPDFKRVVVPLLAEFKNRVPLLFDDIEPNMRQIDNMRKPR